MPKRKRRKPPKPKPLIRRSPHSAPPPTALAHTTPTIYEIDDEDEQLERLAENAEFDTGSVTAVFRLSLVVDSWMVIGKHTRRRSR
jgi:hypothetical protein